MLTTERLELVERLLAASADSAPKLAERLDRLTASVLDDIDTLATAGIIVRNEQDPTNRLSVPYDRVVIEYTIQPDDPTVDPDSAA